MLSAKNFFKICIKLKLETAPHPQCLLSPRTKYKNTSTSHNPTFPKRYPNLQSTTKFLAWLTNLISSTPFRNEKKIKKRPQNKEKRNRLPRYISHCNNPWTSLNLRYKKTLWTALIRIPHIKLQVSEHEHFQLSTIYELNVHFFNISHHSQKRSNELTRS